MSTSNKKDNKYQIAVIPGDGIGKEVMEATISVLDELDVDFDYIYGIAGDECNEEHGTPLPQETIDIVRDSDACLFGAAGETAADVIVKIRQEMKMFANLRPVKSYPNTKSLFENVDFMIVRENTEGLYIADQEEETEDGAIAKRVITREAEERIIDYAFQYAKDNNRTKVTAVHKANVLKKTDGLFKEIFYEVSEKYPDIDTEDFYVDATAMYLVTQPQEFQVVVTTNLFGDILSDEGAGLVGGLGLIPSANIGSDGALFEPVHGSAPDIAGQQKANPIAMMLSAIMMLRYLGENDAADKFDAAILKVMRKYGINEGELLDVQLMRSSRYASQLERIISPEGTYPLLGKSLAYRTGIFHLLAQAALFKILPRNMETSQVRSALTKVLRTQFGGHQNFDNKGWLTIGLNGCQAEIAEKNINTGSLYGCCAIFLPLGLSFNDSFWVGPFEEWTTLKAWNGNPVEPDQSIDF